MAKSQTDKEKVYIQGELQDVLTYNFFQNSARDARQADRSIAVNGTSRVPLKNGSNIGFLPELSENTDLKAVLEHWKQREGKVRQKPMKNNVREIIRTTGEIARLPHKKFKDIHNVKNKSTKLTGIRRTKRDLGPVIINENRPKMRIKKIRFIGVIRVGHTINNQSRNLPSRGSSKAHEGPKFAARTVT